MNASDGTLFSLQTQIDDLKAELDALRRAVGKRRKTEPGWLSLSEAATLAGLSKSALQTRLSRDARDPRGFHPRRRHGGIHKRDLESWIATWAKTPSGAVIRRAVDAALGD